MFQTTTLGVLTPFLGGGYLGELLAQIHRSAQVHGVRVIAIRTGNKGRFDLPIALGHIDGWIVVLNSISPEYLERLIATGKPIVSIAHNFGNASVVSVESENEESTARAVGELIQAGHRHIAYMGHLAEYNVMCRLEGYRHALASHGIPYRPEYVFDTDESGHVGGMRAARDILTRRIPITVAFAGTDRNAVGAITCFQESGLRVPEDIAVIGYDNSFSARRCVPPLATIDQNLDQLAERAVSVALEQIQCGQQRGGRELVTNVFIPRHSSGLSLDDASDEHHRLTPEMITDDDLTTTVGVSYEISRDLITASFERIESLMTLLVPYVQWACIGRWDEPLAEPDKLTIRHIQNYGEDHIDEREVISSNLVAFPPLAAMGKLESFDEQHFICVLPVLTENRRLGVIAVSGLIPPGATSRYSGVMHYLELLAPAFARSALDGELAAYQAGLEELVKQRTAELMVAKERAELANRTRSVLLADMKRLATIGQEITTTLDTETVLKALYHRVGALLDAPSLSIWLIDGNELELRFGVEDGRPLPRLRIALDSQSSYAARSARERREMLVELAPGQEETGQSLDSQAMRTALFAPLIAGGEVLGVLLVQSVEEKAYGERERQIVRTLSAYGAVALANAAHAQQLASATAELEHEKMRNVLVHAGKMVAVGRLASGVVHEMSHPVGTIALLTDNVGKLLEQGRPTDAAEMVPDITHEVVRLRNLIRRLRNFSRSDPPRISVHNLRTVFDDARRLFWPRVKMEKIDYHEEIEGVGIQADPERLSLVIANLMFNAADAMATSPRKAIFVSSVMAEDVVWLLVRDTGPGLSPEAMRHLFEPFFTSKPEGQGLGLGLALSAESLTSMNARIEARNHAEGGAEFRLALRLSEEPLAQVGEGHMNADSKAATS
ncbi:MAG TPA: substrate-binding domain-containing protein [Burkholderiales bacterium]|nr:substrate-binding domain-containing protein [Burkholderiales bacterium]